MQNEAHKPDQTDQPSPGTDHLTSEPPGSVPEKDGGQRRQEGVGRPHMSGFPADFWREA